MPLRHKSLFDENECKAKPPGSNRFRHTPGEFLEECDRHFRLALCVFFHPYRKCIFLMFIAIAPHKGLSLIFKGPSYPSSTTLDLVPQTFNIRILCATDTSDPKFVSYDGKEAQVEWSSSAGCGFSAPGDGSSPEKPSDDEGKGGEPETEKVGSGLGYFFLL